ncbi:hypothetical protein ACUNEO_25630 [Serratia sp. IR-2025]
MMAAKTKYFAIDANGARHTRTSARTYTHMVVVLCSQTKLREQLSSEANRIIHARNHAFYCKEAATPPAPNMGESPKRRAFYNEVAAMTCEQYVNKRVAEELAELNAKGSGEYEDFYRDFGWCGRLDLAQKLAAKWAGRGKVEILEAQSE